MASVEAMTKDLIAELARIQIPGSIPEKDGESFAIPGQIAAGEDRYILTSREMERLLESIARELKRHDGQLAQSHTDKEWNWLVRGTFGPALAAIDLDDDRVQSARAVLTSVRAQLAESSPVQDCEHAFGCTLFGRCDVEAFQIGPVRFEPREIWLARKVGDKDVSRVTARRVRLTWSGKKLRKRKQSLEAMRERDVRDAVGKCPYVCSVRTQGLASEAGRLKAQVAAHLAMAAVALRWQTPSKALAGFNLLTDPGVRRQRSLVFMPRKRTLAGGHLMGLPHGPTISAADWSAELEANKDDFAMIGEAISYFLSASGASPRPRLMNTLAQALLWFHEACRDEVDLMSVVKFSASLDALANGRKAGGIRRLINARLGLQDGQIIRKDGPTMKAAVDEVYSEGRSRTIHGTNDRLGHDWSSTRRLAEQFARLCLIAVIDWTVKNPVIDDPAALQK